MALGAATIPSAPGAREKGLNWRPWSSTLARFLVAGGISYAVNQALLYSLYEHTLASLTRALRTPLGTWELRLLLASAIALEASILVRFALNDLWTFPSRRGKPLPRRLYESNFGSIAAPLIALAAVNLLTSALGVSYLVSNSAGILLGLGWNWLWSSRVVWRKDAVPSTGPGRARCRGAASFPRKDAPALVRRRP